jgi:hypothetical protein
MRRFAWIFLLLFALAGTASAIPTLPAEFSGTVTIDGSPALAGTVITALIDDRDCGMLTLTAAGVYGGEDVLDSRLIVSGEDSDAGKTITFLVDGVAAAETAVYTSGTSTQLALTVTEGGTSGTTSDTSSGSSSGGGGGGSSGSTSSTATSAATATTYTASDVPDTDAPDTTDSTAAATTAPTVAGSPTSGPTAAATTAQQAGLPSPWLTVLPALAGAALLVRARNRG